MGLSHSLIFDQGQRRRGQGIFFQQGYRNGQYLMSLSDRGFGVVMMPPQVHQTAVVIQNSVNLKRQTLRLEEDKENPGIYLVSFNFDATVAGCISVSFLVKDGPSLSFTPLKPDIHRPVRFNFDRGLGQTFCQTSGSGVKLSLFKPDELCRDGKEDIFSLVIRMESVQQPSGSSGLQFAPVESPLPKTVCAQTTYAVMEGKRGGIYGVKVIKQVILVDGVRYELQEIYGVGNATDSSSCRECVICLTNPRDTALLPCRHMCMCSECARILRFQTQRCPVCRCVVEKLLEIKVPRNNEEQETNAPSI